ncbi:hypothetical protein [Roseiconus lacunae]|uniref:Glycosyltransferase RgtA/B/C/D-like domain-containing protein n=1 Tax=Roseiconus lacunae TaxID=2605694 RepID=A0ABT7PQ49_9BACT|nr:hypothetical protein [Roseiconus lacunae]MDM4018630.1 hypothetical protein [Roseiconus lacunae]
MSEVDPNSKGVRGIYALLIIATLAVVSGRIAVVISREGDTAFLSANDRSRWCTIAALVEYGTYEIDDYLNRRGAKQNRRPWATIDLVRHVGDDGKLHYYSSKPPLLPTIYAGVYYCVANTMGMWLSDQPIYLGRVILWLVNVPTLAIYLLATIFSIDRLSLRPWAKCFLATATCLGTMLLPFSISLSNHLPAAASAATVMAIYVGSMDRKLGFGWWLLAGLAGGFLAANELPALSMTVFFGGMLLLVRREGLVGYTLGVVVVAVAFFGTNWIAHHSLRPPYTHRGNGPIIAARATSPDQTPEATKAWLVEQSLASNSSTVQQFESREPNRRRVLVDGSQQYALIRHPNGSTELRHWDDWYDYPGSYWVDGRRRGVDLGEPSRLVYFANMTIGHYGLFSLTPLWCLVPFGLAGLFRVERREHQLLLAAIGTASIVCIAFYVMRPEIDRNYGGVSVCFRWMLWFAPLWLLSLSRPVNWLSERNWGRGLALLLLAFSMFSVSTALQGPWQSPWLYRFWQFLGWITA